MSLIVVPLITGWLLFSSRYNDIKLFCTAYIYSNDEFMSKPLRVAINEVGDNRIFNTLPKLNLHAVAVEVFNSRPHTLPYIIPLLEYALRVSIDSNSPDQMITSLTNIIYNHSTFHPRLY